MTIFEYGFLALVFVVLFVVALVVGRSVVGGPTV